ncbi:Uncharacterized protein At3g17950 [Linum perenne]
MIPLPPPSPTSSSVSSSDLDTESTDSFFHDRSTTLGTLMGVTFPAAAAVFLGGFSTQSAPPAMDLINSRKQRRVMRIKKKFHQPTVVAERRRKWWSLPESMSFGLLRSSKRGGCAAGDGRFQLRLLLCTWGGSVDFDGCCQQSSRCGEGEKGKTTQI